MQEITAHSGKIIAIATEGDKEIANLADDVIYISRILEMLTPFLLVISLQFFAYYFRVAKLFDVNKQKFRKKCDSKVNSCYCEQKVVKHGNLEIKRIKKRDCRGRYVSLQ